MTVVIIILTYVSVSGMLSKTCRTFRKYHVQSDLWFLLSPFYTARRNKRDVLAHHMAVQIGLYGERLCNKSRDQEGAIVLYDIVQY